jgi:uncharacterized cupredoxin-like copper-binding protein
VPGRYSFAIRNTGKTQHELIAFRTDLAPANLPLDATGDVNEDGPGLTKATDGDNVHAGKSQTRSIGLTSPGAYIFVCNLPGHFKAGMYAVATVSSL